MYVEGGCGGGVVSLINPNGSREDTLEAMLCGVERLSAISNAIFDAIRRRLEEQRAGIQSLHKRVDTAAERVAQVKGSSKALRILSSAKYPDVSEEETALGSMLHPLILNLPPSTPQDSRDSREGLIPPRDDLPTRFQPPVAHPDDLLACFHVREPSTGSLASSLLTPGLGSGGPPPSLQNIDSFLLFNTAENPYLHYRLPGKVGKGRGPGGGSTVNKNLLAGGTASFTDSPSYTKEVEVEEEIGGGGDDFYYSPSSNKDIPELDVPDLLPDLAGIVDNLDLFSSPTPLPLKGGDGGFTPIIEKTPTLSTSTPSAPPPTKSQTVATSVPGPAPPPPPPPPAPAALNPPPILKSTTSSGGEQLRSNLMEAIRAAGGADKAALRSAQERKYETKKNRKQKQELLEEKEGSTPSAPAVKLDLMADLKNSLAMRRKGISGIREPPPKHGRGPMAGQMAGGVGGIMQKLAATIPMNQSEEEDFGNEPDSEEEEVDDWD